MKLLISFLIMMAYFPALANQVLKVGRDGKSVAISHLPFRNFIEADKLCVFRDKQSVGCGEVIRSNNFGAVLRLENWESKVEVGDDVKLASLEPDENSTGGDSQFRVVSSHPDDQDHSTFMLSGGIHLYFPMVQIHWNLTNNVALFLMPTYMEARTQGYVGKMIGALVGVEYFSGKEYDGFWMQFAYGSLAAKWNPSGNTANIINVRSSYAYFIAGWRWDLGKSTSLGFGVGVGTLGSGPLQNNKIRLHSPTAMLDFGIKL